MRRAVRAGLGPLLCVGLVAGAAQAEVRDSNGDGVFSRAEMQAAYPKMTEAQWQDSDADKDGVVSQEELLAAIEGEVLWGAK